MSEHIPENHRIVKLGRRIGGVSTVVVTAILPCMLWWKACLRER